MNACIARSNVHTFLSICAWDLGPVATPVVPAGSKKQVMRKLIFCVMY